MLVITIITATTTTTTTARQPDNSLNMPTYKYVQSTIGLVEEKLGCRTNYPKHSLWEYEPTVKTCVYRPSDYPDHRFNRALYPMKHCVKCHLKPCIGLSMHRQAYAVAKGMTVGAAKGNRNLKNKVKKKLLTTLHAEYCRLFRVECKDRNQPPPCCMESAEDVSDFVWEKHVDGMHGGSLSDDFSVVTLNVNLDGQAASSSLESPREREQWKVIESILKSHETPTPTKSPSTSMKSPCSTRKRLHNTIDY